MRRGDRLPPERDLARHYGCSLITVRRALDELTREKRIERTRGRGTHVLQPRIDRDLADTNSFAQEMTRLGLVAETRVLAARPEPAGEAVARPFSWSRATHALPGAAASRLERAAVAGDGPPAGRAFPGPARLGPRARLAVRAAHGAATPPRLQRPARRSSRCCSKRTRRGCSVRSHGARPCSSRALPTRLQECRLSSAAPSFAGIGPATSSKGSSCAKERVRPTDSQSRYWPASAKPGNRRRKRT